MNHRHKITLLESFQFTAMTRTRQAERFSSHRFCSIANRVTSKKSSAPSQIARKLLISSNAKKPPQGLKALEPSVLQPCQKKRQALRLWSHLFAASPRKAYQLQRLLEISILRGKFMSHGNSCCFSPLQLNGISFQCLDKILRAGHNVAEVSSHFFICAGLLFDKLLQPQVLELYFP